jgi:cation transport ATPase
LNDPARRTAETTVAADILLVHGTCIVNEAMLSGESTPLLKESIQLLEGSESLDVDGAHKNAVLFSGTKVLQASGTTSMSDSIHSSTIVLPDRIFLKVTWLPQSKRLTVAASELFFVRDLAQHKVNLSEQ